MFHELLAIHAAFVTLIGGLLYLCRKKIFGELNLIGTFVFFWFVLDYLGMVITSLYPGLVFDYWDYLELTFFTDDKNLKMVLYNNIGLFIFLLGALLIPAPKSNPLRAVAGGKLGLASTIAFNPLSGMRFSLAVGYFIVFFGFGFYLIVRDMGFNIPLYTLLVSDFAQAYGQRVERQMSGPMQAYITWNVVPYLATYLAAYCWFRGKSSPVFLGLTFLPLFLSAVSLLALLHKREFITWLAVFVFLSLLIRKQTSRNSKRIPLLKLALGGLLIYGVLVFCFMAFSSFNRFDRGLPWALEVSFMELCFRGTLSSLPYFSLIPDLVPYHEFQNIGLFRRIFGLPVMYSDTQILFSYLYPHLRDPLGSISSNMITDFYGAFGLTSLIFCSFLGGVGLGALNYLFLRLPNTLPNIVYKSFMLLFPINLCVATYFQSAFGYGLFFYTICWLSLRIGNRRPSGLSSLPERPENYARRTIQGAIPVNY